MDDQKHADECRRALPLPQPTEAAVEAGIFGRCADGSLRPNIEEIRSIVEAQVYGLADLALRMESCQRAERTGRHPTSGKLARKAETKAAFQQSARQLRHDARIEFFGHLRAYEDAFGVEAARQLEEFVYSFASTQINPPESTMRQLKLF